MARARKAPQPNPRKTPRVRKASHRPSTPACGTVDDMTNLIIEEYLDSQGICDTDLSTTMISAVQIPAATPLANTASSVPTKTCLSAETPPEIFSTANPSLASPTPANLPVSGSTVLVHEDHFDSWTETVELYAISRFGAAFNVSRACGIGRLIELSIFASLNHAKTEIADHSVPVVCLVQQCNEYDREGKTAYHVGVVFVGRSFPESYNRNPTQCFRVVGTHKDGHFRIQETAAPHKPRRHPRFRKKFAVQLLLINKADRTIVRAAGVTNDVGALGISVVSTLDANIGDKIKVGCREIDFFGVAVVRNRRSMFGFERLLQMEFLDSKFPISRLLSVPEGVLEGFTK